MMNFKLLTSCILILIMFSKTAPMALAQKARITMSKEVLMDKIKGGWAGQTIGVTFGGPTEFRYLGVYMQDNEPIPWYDGYLSHSMMHSPHLYDDIYMDLTFVDIIEKLGVDAPVDSFAQAFAHAEYPLWHANQIARYNILNGIKAPASGHWKNNPHADDIDYQIESDFAGLMNPAMPNAASQISDKIGHIMNYGDGWYGGVYVGAMYSIAFNSQDINYIVKEALKTIPKKSQFYQCINDVILWHQKHPNDWKQTWTHIQQKWADEVGCPDGVHAAFNIDAKLNAAYIVLGLLYGQGDFTKTLEISTRAGQDSDCNPASAAGVLGVMHGYSQIPAHWKMGLEEAENLNFMYTKTSLNKVYETSYKHALEMILRNSGKDLGSSMEIKVQKPKPVRFEKSFEGIYPIQKIAVAKSLDQGYEFEFEGTGFVITGSAQKSNKNLADATLEVRVLVDGLEQQQVLMPTNQLIRKDDIYWNYDLTKGKHRVQLIPINSKNGYAINLNHYIIYDNKPNKKHVHP
ncbi:ADP-ribosylglycohydrolase family protein [Sphingobacterium sp. HJSM2_6]|uniref:ADP-ribosylglycohydrolase family protein n=1 Tax=Sphingobacterium sp. HJSM2_6 TaxID=3366264 RepID=UPI003BCB2939